MITGKNDESVHRYLVMYQHRRFRCLVDDAICRPSLQRIVQSSGPHIGSTLALVALIPVLALSRTLNLGTLFRGRSRHWGQHRGFLLA